jgi:hypothetical protein
MATPEEESRKLLCVCGKHTRARSPRRDSGSSVDAARKRRRYRTESRTFSRPRHSCRNAEDRRAAPRSGRRVYQRVDAEV